jgi:hypothetical protein
VDIRSSPDEDEPPNPENGEASPLRGSRVARTVLRLVYLGGSGWFGLVGLVAAEVRCDESCFDTGAPGANWRRDAEAWQWAAMGWFGGALLVVAILVVLSARPRPKLARGFLALQAIAAAGLVVVLDGRWGGGSTALVLAGVLLCGFVLTKPDVVARLGGEDPRSFRAGPGENA